MMTTSVCGTSLPTISRAAGLERSRGRLFFPRLMEIYVLLSRGTTGEFRRQGSPQGGSTLMTSAPMSASSIPPKGAAIISENSSTRTPVSGPLITHPILGGSPCYGTDSTPLAKGGSVRPTGPASAVESRRQRCATGLMLHLTRDASRYSPRPDLGAAARHVEPAAQACHQPGGLRMVALGLGRRSPPSHGRGPALAEPHRAARLVVRSGLHRHPHRLLHAPRPWLRSRRPLPGLSHRPRRRPGPGADTWRRHPGREHRAGGSGGHRDGGPGHLRRALVGDGSPISYETPWSC